MRKYLCISIYCRIFASEKETNNKLNPKTRKGREIMKQIDLENGYKVTFNEDINEETANAIQNFLDFYFCKQNMSAQTMFDEITTRWNVVPHFIDPNTETFSGVPIEGTMNTYFAIKRADGRYMKIRQNGKTRNWVKNLKGASVGTEAKMQACLDVIQREYRRLGRETDADGCQLVKVGEAASAWQAKLEAVNKQSVEL